MTPDSSAFNIKRDPFQNLCGNSGFQVGSKDSFHKLILGIDKVAVFCIMKPAILVLLSE